MGSEEVSIDSGESGTDGKMSERIVKNINILEGINQESITIIMNNPGGDEYHGLAIYDAIKTAKSHVTIKVYGMAMSMGSIILQAADERILSPNARFMIHYGYFSMSEHAKTVYKWTEENKKVDVWMEELFLEKIHQKHPDFKLKKIQEMCNFDTILSAKETVELGLADKILGDENV
jgi:ATP-dependent Clp protease protease subunit